MSFDCTHQETGGFCYVVAILRGIFSNLLDLRKVSRLCSVYVVIRDRLEEC